MDQIYPLIQALKWQDIAAIAGIIFGIVSTIAYSEQRRASRVQALFFLMLAVIVISSNACSCILHERYLQAEVAGSEWVELHPTGPYRYEANSVTLDLCRSSDAGGFISLGPTIVFPIIPTFYTAPDPNSFKLVIDNPLDDPVILDTSRIRMELSNHGWTWPRRIGISENAVDTCNSYPQKERKVGGMVYLPKGKRMISLNFGLHIDPDFDLDLGIISMNGTDYVIPKLKYNKTCKEMIYLPIADPHFPSIQLKKCE